MSAQRLFLWLGVLALVSGPMATAAPEPPPEPPPEVKDGDEALSSKKWDMADEAYRAVLEEAPKCWQAREGLARALAARDRMPEALQAWRRALLDADRSTIPAGDRQRLRDARAGLAQHDPLTRELDKLIKTAAKDVVRFAGSKKKKAPALAESMLRRALRMDPLTSEASAGLSKLHALPWDQWAKQWRGTFADFGGVNSPEWKVIDDSSFEINGLKSAFGTFSNQQFTGDFDMRVEMRVDEKGGDSWLASLTGAVQGRSDRVEFGLTQGSLYLRFKRWKKDKALSVYNKPIDRLDPKLDPGEFNLYELQFRGDKITALVNGHVVVTKRRSFHARRGSIGIHCQLAKVVFRNMEVRQR